MKLSEALALFLVQCDANGRSPHTRAQHARSIRWLISALGDREIEDVTPADIARFLVSPAARQTRFGFAKSPATVNALRTSLRCFFRYAHDAGYARANAARLVKRAICSPAPPRGLSDAELARLEAIMAGAWSQPARRDRVLVHLLLASGIRLGSALALDVGDVDLANGELWLRSMKAGRRDRVFLGRVIAAELRGLIGARESGAVFASKSGTRLCRRSVQRRIVAWLRAAGVRRGSSHSFRHAFAMALYRRTGNVLIVQRALTHRSLASSVTYAHAIDVEVRSAVASVATTRSAPSCFVGVGQWYRSPDGDPRRSDFGDSAR